MEELIGKYVYDTDYNDIGKIVRIEGRYALVQWVQINSEYHKGNKFAKYKVDRLIPRFEVKNRLEVLADAI